MNILHVTAGVGKAAFGVAPVVMGLAREQQKLGHFVRIWHTDSRENELWASEYSGLDISTFRSFPKVGPKQLCYSPAMEKAAVGAEGKEFDILHHHGMWLGISRATVKWSRTHKKPTIVAPHGMLEPWALQQSKLKKKLAYLFFEKNNLQGAACLHACSELEKNNLRESGFQNPIKVIPNGIDESWISSTGDGLRFRRKYGISDDSFVIFYLGRLAPIKRIPLLLEAMCMVMNEHRNIKLILAGNGADEYVVTLKAMVSEYKLEDAVVFAGALYDQEKRNAFEAANITVLPSHSENFGIVIAESLATGTPAIATKGTPWSELENNQCGWWVDPNAESLSQALIKAASLSDNVLSEMGKRGCELVKSKYTWPMCGEVSVKVYTDILEGAS